MRKCGMIALCWVLGLTVSGQPQPQFYKIDSTAESEKYWSAWFENLFEMGVELNKDSIKINEEAKKIITDSNYRKSIYPEIYTWEATTAHLKIMELKKGFWFLINLYSSDTANKDLVIQSLVPFDKMMDMQKVLTSTFYSYAMLDPKVCTYNNGKPVITRPDLIELRFSKLKEIVSYIIYFRNELKK